jgi:hypothetical protein
VTFNASQLRRTGTIHVKATIEEVFPLLCPKREEEWIPGWECETIWSTTGYNEEGNALLSRYKGKDFPGRLAALEGFMSHCLEGKRL